MLTTVDSLGKFFLLEIIKSNESMYELKHCFESYCIWWAVVVSGEMRDNGMAEQMLHLSAPAPALVMAVWHQCGMV